MDSLHHRYQYEPIDAASQIRVLLLEPADCFEAPLKACLVPEHITLDFPSSPEPTVVHRTPKYDAVSYCWGEPDFSAHLILAGKAFRITPNVDAMLRHLRTPTKARRLWVDAVCINQNNNSEKDEQVQRMGTIFGSAEKVRVWLGTPATGDDIAATFSDLIDYVTWHRLRENVTIPVDGFEWSAFPRSIDRILRLLSQPWFRRRWILQEVVLAHNITVHCGTEKISWQWLINAMNALHATQRIRGMNALHAARRESACSWLPEATDTLCGYARQAVDTIVDLHLPPYDLLGLLFKCHAAECANPRDRLFALYGLASPVIGLTQARISRQHLPHEPPDKLCPVDYSKDWVETYTLFARKCISHGHSKTLFQHLLSFGSLYDQNQDWPSWVPGWNKERITDLERFRPERDVSIWPDVFDKNIVSVEPYGAVRMVGRLSGIELIKTSKPSCYWKARIQCLPPDLAALILQDLRHPGSPPFSFSALITALEGLYMFCMNISDSRYLGITNSLLQESDLVFQPYQALKLQHNSPKVDGETLTSRSVIMLRSTTAADRLRAFRGNSFRFLGTGLMYRETPGSRLRPDDQGVVYLL